MYSRAYSLLMFPISNLRGPINAVAFPALSRLQNEPAAYRVYYYRITSIVALVSMPLCAFCFVAGTPIIQIALGSRWQGVGPVFSWLACAAFLQPVSSQRGLVLLSIGQGRKYFIQGLIATVVTVVGIGCGLPFGIKGVAIGYSASVCLLFYPINLYCFRDTPICAMNLLKGILPPAISSLTAAVLTLLVQSQIRFQSPWANLALVLTAFALSFITIVYLMPSLRMELLNIIKTLTTKPSKR